MALAYAISTNQYKPLPLRERAIPKRNKREMRRLRIPTVTDRVVQRAVLEVLYPITEGYFLPCSFGYRPGRGLQDAVRVMQRFRRRGLMWVLDADIDDYFNQVDHALLRSFLRRDLPDESLLRLIDLWLDKGRATPDEARGIPMGSPLSPVLANVYLHRLDRVLLREGLALVRYADDFVVLAGDESAALACREQVAAVLDSLKLRYEPSKTSVTSFDAGFEFLGVHFENGYYWYLHEEKRIEVHGEDVLSGRYMPDY